MEPMGTTGKRAVILVIVIAAMALLVDALVQRTTHSVIVAAVAVFIAVGLVLGLIRRGPR
jgi:predicted Na+-dependent transporter